MRAIEGFVSVVEDFVNTFSNDKLEKAGKELARIHPTLQQNFFRVIATFILAEAENERVDARNEATVELCKEMAEVLKRSKYCSKDRVYLPFI